MSTERHSPADPRAATLARRAERYAARLAEDRVEGLAHVAFLRDGVRYLVPLDALAEIRPLERMARLPGVARAIIGVVHVGGRVVAVHDLGWRRAESGPRTASWLLICGGDHDRMALAADSVDDVRHVDPERLRAPPVTLGLPPSCAPALTDNAEIVLDLDGLSREPAFFKA